MKVKYLRLDPLVKKMEKVVEALVNFQKQEALEMLLEELPEELPIENFDLLIDFLGEYLWEVWELRRILFDPAITPEKEEILRKANQSKIAFLRERGASIGYSLKVLRALTRVITENTANFREVEKWKKRLPVLKEKNLQKLKI